MKLVCLDLEGVLVPEIWISFSEATGIKELRLTTRDVPDYDALMKRRIGILEHHSLKLKDIQKVIAGMNPLEGAEEFLKTLREKTQLVILSDTFDQFAKPLMKKLDWPTLFCNTLIVNGTGMIQGYRLRRQDGKKNAVAGFKEMGFTVLAAGDSYNDISMLKTADKGYLFRPPETIIQEYPELPVAMDHTELLNLILEEI
jgi:phosphoserine/homoserine phosphotransferase